jgi:hypothetical protein
MLSDVMSAATTQHGRHLARECRPDMFSLALSKGERLVGQRLDGQLLQVHNAERLDQRRLFTAEKNDDGRRCAALSTGATAAMSPELSRFEKPTGRQWPRGGREKVNVQQDEVIGR